MITETLKLAAAHKARWIALMVQAVEIRKRIQGSVSK